MELNTMKRVMTFLMFFISLFSATAHADANLYQELSRRNEVKVVVQPIKDSSKDHKADTKDLKSKLEKALSERKSIHFKNAQQLSDADIVIKAEILDFYWTDKDPVDMIMGVGAVAMDAMVTENYARMIAHFSISDAKDKILWQDEVMATITSKTMTAEQSVKMINDDMAKVFVRKAFGKKSKV
jgi:hypothetical protein